MSDWGIEDHFEWRLGAGVLAAAAGLGVFGVSALVWTAFVFLVTP